MVRLLQQLSSAFKTMHIDKFHALCPPGMPWFEVERCVMAAVHVTEQLRVRLDHRARLLVFVPEDMDAPRMRYQLATLATLLQQVHDKIYPVSAAEKEHERRGVFEHVRNNVERVRPASRAVCLREG